MSFQISDPLKVTHATETEPATIEKLKKIRIMFLDIEGVLRSNLALLSPKDLFCQKALDELNRLIQNIETASQEEVGIVLSSDWRFKGDLKFLKEFFKQYPFFSEHLIGKTPGSKASRAEEIKQWLLDNKNYEVLSFCVIDDIDDGLSKTFRDQFVHCKWLGKLFGEKGTYETASLILSQGISALPPVDIMQISSPKSLAPEIDHMETVSLSSSASSNTSNLSSGPNTPVPIGFSLGAVKCIEVASPLTLTVSRDPEDPVALIPPLRL